MGVNSANTARDSLSYVNELKRQQQFSIALEKQDLKKMSSISKEDALIKMKRSSMSVDLPLMDDDDDENEDSTEGKIPRKTLGILQKVADETKRVRNQT